MARIPLLQVGCTGQEVIDAINALIAAHNDGDETGVVSYNDLADKPQINGVELKGNKSTAALLVALAGCTDYNAIMATLATKTYSDAGDTALVEAAAAAAQAALDSKLDKDLGNIEMVDVFNGEALVPIVTNNGVKKTKISSIAVYTEFQAQSIKTAADTTIDRYRKMLPIEGEKDGTNKVYTVTGGYKTGTSSLYLNGALQTLGRDYEETDTTTFTFIHVAPEEGDEIIFRAIPLE